MNKSHHHILMSIKTSKKIINAEGSKYPIVKEVAHKRGFQIGSDFYTLYWTDAALSVKDIRQLPPHVRVNHLPDITVLTRKNKMAIALNSMARYFPKDYDFYPQTLLLPMDWLVLQKKQTQKDRFYIIKPENGCQGKGIYLTNSPTKLDKTIPMVVQRYITNPLLIDNLKFDLRIYVLITCVQPLRIYMYQDGLARFATQPFEEPNQNNMGDLFTHLTNYAINKNHEGFVVDSEDFGKGHKRLLSTLFSPEILKLVRSNISDIVIKSVISVLPILQNALTLCKKDNLNSCFQLLGFDILMTDNFKFKLLQINQNPSLMTQTSIDVSLKKDMLSSLFAMIESTFSTFEDRTQSKIRNKDRNQMESCGDFMRIYPCQNVHDTQAYDQFISKSQELYREKFGLGVLRQSKKEAPKQCSYIQWNESSEFYSKDKLAKIYRSSNRNHKTSQKQRLLFY